MSDTPAVLQMRGICKQYPGVQALNGASLDVRAGEVHVLLGENGRRQVDPHERIAIAATGARETGHAVQVRSSPA